MMEEMKKQASELIQQTYRRGFKDGRKDGYEQGRIDGYEDWKYSVFNDGTIDAESFIEKGRDEAWEAARKLVGTSYKECNEIFSDGDLTIETNDDIFARYTASEAIEKLRKFAEVLKKQEEDSEIHVGDEVIINKNAISNFTNTKAIVTMIDDTSCPYNVMVANGDTEWLEKDEIHKTGRNFPELAELLKKLKEDK